MLHRKLVVVMAGLVLLGLTAGTSSEQVAKQKISIRLFLPHEDAKVTVNNKKIKGSGVERTINTVVVGDEVTVKAVWEPNNYTKITRKKTVAVKGDVTIDLTKADPKFPDDIVVIYVPTPQDVVDAMCKMGRVNKDDIVYDLGCGDGRMVITAVKTFGAKRGVGVDLDPVRIKECKENAKKAGVEDKLEFRVGDVLKVKDLSDATVVLLYMGEDINKRLKPILKDTLKPGSRVVSHRFLMGDDWKPLKSETVNSSAGYPCDVHLWEIAGKK